MPGSVASDVNQTSIATNSFVAQYIVTIDSNILIDYLNGNPSLVERLNRWRTERRNLVISTMTITEVLSLRLLSASQISDYRRFLHTFVTVPVDERIADVAAGLRRQYRLSIGDAVIAATALSLSTPLVTNDQDFHKVRELEIVEL